MYDSSLKYKRDNKNVLDYAVKEGTAQGIEKGIAQGRVEIAIDIARELKKTGMCLEDIAKGTKLSIEEIEKL
jgi:predicted transposase/invertase (TIGR01784 family)